MTIIYNTRNSEEQINRIYNDYDLAYIGKQFSESFKEWNYCFYNNMKPILNGAYTAILPGGYLQYAYTECTITYIAYIIRGKITAIIILNYNFNQKVLEDVRMGTQSERASLGMTRSSATTTPSKINLNNYVEVKDYGTIYGDSVVLVKKKGKRKQQLFNYICYPKTGGAPYIMYSQDFYSANPFLHNVAYAWGTDGHKYELGAGGRMRVVENVKSINTIITETINDYLINNVLLAS